MKPIFIAPFSNSYIRDWPVAHYSSLIGLLLDRLPPEVEIRVVGTASQRLNAHEIVRHHPVERVSNTCGRLRWDELVTHLQSARCVIGNNSGIVHLSAHFRTPTVCVFGGSHQRHEWRALGSSVVLVSRVIGCSPCQLDHGQASPYDKACLRQIAPSTVADAAFAIMARDERGVAFGRGAGLSKAEKSPGKPIGHDDHV